MLAVIYDVENAAIEAAGRLTAYYNRLDILASAEWSINDQDECSHITGKRVTYRINGEWLHWQRVTTKALARELINSLTAAEAATVTRYLSNEHLTRLMKYYQSDYVS